MNKAILIGRLGADPEVKTTANGMQIANLRIATGERVKVDGEWTKGVEWHKVTVFGKTAENVGRFLTKGRQCAIEGRIVTRKWQDKDGNDRWSTEIVAHSVEFIGGAGDNAGGAQQSSGSGKTSNYGEPNGGQDESIPF